MRRGSRGLTLIECVAATALVGVALLASTGLLLEWERCSGRLERRALAEHALAQEVDALLVRGLDRLPLGESAWSSGADESCGLPEARGVLRVEPWKSPPLRRVTLVLEWADGRAVRETLAGGAR